VMAGRLPGEVVWVARQPEVFVHPLEPEQAQRFKIPRSVDYTDELPRDPNGKLYKRKLRVPQWADRDHAI
jgi:acyl-CoA synthetase (AMP-forming)/AMP-acid ligase II